VTFARHFRRNGGAVFCFPEQRDTMTARSLGVRCEEPHLFDAIGARRVDVRLGRHLDESALAQRFREAAIPTEDER